MSIGTPPRNFTVVFDPFTSGIWIPSSDCSDCDGHAKYAPATSSSAVPNGNRWVGTFYGSTLSGHLAYDTIHIGGTSVGVTFAAVTSVPSPTRWFASAPFDGVVGIAPIPPATTLLQSRSELIDVAGDIAATAVRSRDTAPTTPTPLLQALHANRLVDERAYGIYVQPFDEAARAARTHRATTGIGDDSDPHVAAVELHLGGYDVARLVSCFVYAPVRVPQLTASGLGAAHGDGPEARIANQLRGAIRPSSWEILATVLVGGYDVPDKRHVALHAGSVLKDDRRSTAADGGSRAGDHSEVAVIGPHTVVFDHNTDDVLFPRDTAARINRILGCAPVHHNGNASAGNDATECVFTQCPPANVPPLVFKLGPRGVAVDVVATGLVRATRAALAHGAIANARNGRGELCVSRVRAHNFPPRDGVDAAILGTAFTQRWYSYFDDYDLDPLQVGFGRTTM